MNRKYQQFVPVCLLLAVLLIIVVLISVCKPKIEEYVDADSEFKRNQSTKQKIEEESEREIALKAAQEMKLKALKPIYKAEVDGASYGLGVFGNMFEDIIKLAQRNGLLIRSIEYKMNPDDDPLYSINPDSFNVCELKFFFVATYVQMQEFLLDINKNFEYLTYLSGISVTAFKENPDYLLVKTSINLYSEKPEGAVKKSRNVKK